MRSIAVLMTCFNRKNTTLECLEHLYSAFKNVEHFSPSVYLVDDQSSDGTKEQVALTYPDVHLIDGTGDLYWGGGMRKAWEVASETQHDYYLWLNDDTFLFDYAMEILLADAKTLDNRAIIVGVCEWKHNQEVSYSGYTQKHKKRMKPIGNPLKCDWFNGNVILISNQIYEKVGYIDSIFRHNLGDTDYALRARKLGFPSYISSYTVGKCDSHTYLTAWSNPELSFKARWQNFNTPLAKGPKQVFKFERRHSTLAMAIYRSSVIYARFLFPSLWVALGKHKMGEG